MLSRAAARAFRAAGVVVVVAMLAAAALSAGASAHKPDKTAPATPATAPPNGQPGSFTNPLTPEPAGVSILASGCSSGLVCFWDHQDYQGNKVWYGNDSAGYWWYVVSNHNSYHSLKNEFDNRAVWTSDGVTTKCTGHNQWRAQPPAFNQFFIGGAGTGNYC